MGLDAASLRFRHRHNIAHSPRGSPAKTVYAARPLPLWDRCEVVMLRHRHKKKTIPPEGPFPHGHLRPAGGGAYKKHRRPNLSGAGTSRVPLVDYAREGLKPKGGSFPPKGEAPGLSLSGDSQKVESWPGYQGRRGLVFRQARPPPAPKRPMLCRL